MSKVMLSPGWKCSKQAPRPMWPPPPSKAPGAWANMASTRVSPDKGNILGRLEPMMRQKMRKCEETVGSEDKHQTNECAVARHTLKAAQLHFTDRSPRQRKSCSGTHVCSLQQPGVMWWRQSVAPSWSHLLVQELHWGHGPGERCAVGQRRTVRSTVRDGEGHALQGAAGRRDLAERHHCGGNEARGEVGGVRRQDERALLGRAAGGGGCGCSRAGAVAATVREGAGWYTQGCAGVLRRCSTGGTSSSSSGRGGRAKSLRGALRKTSVALGGRGWKRALLLRATGVSIQQRRDFLNREPLKNKNEAR